MSADKTLWQLAALALLAVAWGKWQVPGGGGPGGRGSSKGAPGSARSKWDPLGIAKRKEKALATGDPAKMREMARLFRDAGYAAEADELEAAAASTEKARAEWGGGPAI